MVFLQLIYRRVLSNVHFLLPKPVTRLTNTSVLCYLQQVPQIVQPFSSASNCKVIDKQICNCAIFHCGNLNYTHPVIGQQIRGKKDKAGKKSGKPKVELQADELNEIINFNNYEADLRHGLDKLKQEFTENLTIRKSAAKLDNILIDTPDGKFLLIHLAQISQKNPELFVIDLTTSPQYIGNVKAALDSSGMKLNVQQEKTTLYASLPKFTFEQRTALANSAKTICTNTKDKLRNQYKQSVKTIDKEAKTGNFSKDYIHNLKETLEFTMKKYHTEADEILHLKQAELLGEGDNQNDNTHVKKKSKKKK